MTTTNTVALPRTQQDSQRTRTFHPNEHLIQLKEKDYLPVQWRLVWFRQECPQGTIETEIVHLDLEKEASEEVMVWNPEKRHSEKVIKTAPGIAIVRATVKDGKGGQASGVKMEKAASFGDWLEKAETGAIGRALAGLGYGTQFAPEIDEGDRIVDSPVERGNGQAEQQNSAQRSGEPFSEQLAATKNRAKALGLASNAAEWAELLKRLQLSEVRGSADLAKVNGYLTQQEKAKK